MSFGKWKVRFVLKSSLKRSSHKEISFTVVSVDGVMDGQGLAGPWALAPTGSTSTLSTRKERAVGRAAWVQGPGGLGVHYLVKTEKPSFQLCPNPLEEQFLHMKMSQSPSPTP